MKNDMTDEELYSAQTTKVYDVCRKKSASCKLAIFNVVRLDTGEPRHVLGYVDELDKNGYPNEFTKYFILAEFLPALDTEKLYEIKGLSYPPEEEPKGPPLPDNVVKFRRKK